MIGRKRIKTLVESGLIKDVGDLYSLTVPQLECLPGWGEVTAKVFVLNLELSKGHGDAGKALMSLIQKGFFEAPSAVKK